MNALQRLPLLAGVSLIVVILQACSPALNWRQIQLHDLKARLPCKPDNATRQVSLGTASQELQMMGCEAAGALFAISHVRSADDAAAAQVSAQWQASALQVLRGSGSTPQPWQVPKWADTGISLVALGKNPQGQPIQARLTWVQRGADVYHLAVYAERLTDAMTQPFLEDIQAP